MDPESVLKWNDEMKEMRKALDELATVIGFVRNTEKILPELPKKAERPALAPKFWLSRWVDSWDDFVEKGFRCMYNDDTMVVYFGDRKNLILHSNDMDMRFVDHEHFQEYFFTKDTLPILPKFDNMPRKAENLQKAKSVLMKEKVEKDGESESVEELANIPYFHACFHTAVAVCTLLSNGCFELNWKESREKMVICTRQMTVTLMKPDPSVPRKTYLVKELAKHGVTEDLKEKLEYARKTGFIFARERTTMENWFQHKKREMLKSTKMNKK